jgi:beta-glucosidase-like glycosyl hydrolase
MFMMEYNIFIYIPCRDPELVRRIGMATALEVRATGMQYSFAPCLAVSE